jgi:hypothetical protein
VLLVLLLRLLLLQTYIEEEGPQRSSRAAAEGWEG